MGAKNASPYIPENVFFNQDIAEICISLATKQ